MDEKDMATTRQFVHRPDRVWISARLQPAGPLGALATVIWQTERACRNSDRITRLTLYAC